jgi:hypothetical protein
MSDPVKDPNEEEIDLGTNRTFQGKSQDQKQAPKINRPDAPDADIDARGGVGQAGRANTGPGATHMGLKGPKVTGAPTSGSISPGIGYLYILLAMFMVIGAGTLLSGGFLPVDPNGPGGPPTLEPYFNKADYGEQQIILPSNIYRGADKNLQLKTFTVHVCGSKSAVMFVVDTSGSMKFENKMQKTQQGLLDFMKDYTGTGVVGMIRFSNDAQELVKLDKVKTNRSAMQGAIRGLDPDGYTHTREAVALARQRITDAISTNKFPGYKWSLVLLTDGVPEQKPPRKCYIEVPDPNIPAPDKRCFAREQDPTSQPDETAALKSQGVAFYSINIYSPNYATDKIMFPYLDKLLKTAATSPSAPYYQVSVNASDISTQLKVISNAVCEEQGAIADPAVIR